MPSGARDIAMVFQSYALYPHMTVRQNIGFGLKCAAERSQEICPPGRRSVAHCSASAHLLDRRPQELTGGQRQRVALGRAITRDPKVFLLDEPLSNLDAQLRTQMRAELRLLFRRIEGTVVYVTHDQAEAMTLSDRLVVMRNGLVQQVGTPLEVYNNPVNMFVGRFLGSPSMNMVDSTVGSVDGAAVLQTAGGALPVTREMVSGTSSPSTARSPLASALKTSPLLPAMATDCTPPSKSSSRWAPPMSSMPALATSVSRLRPRPRSRPNSTRRSACIWIWKSCTCSIQRPNRCSRCEYYR